jgi:exopolysaccharide biosynthesis WecB/TagA/CpsF family protein
MPIVLDIDDYDLSGFSQVARTFGSNRYGFVVTPNVDHLIRYGDDSQFRLLYAEASYVLLDSRFLSHILTVIGRTRLRVCPGSDLTRHLIRSVIEPSDRVVLVGSQTAQAQILKERFALNDLHHINPPMGFINDPAAFEECILAIEAASPFRYCFLAVGSPQQEMVAHRLKMRGKARGLALCIGASISFITGHERRAPLWMQKMGIEWTFRLMQNPGRLAKRYLWRGPRIFPILANLQLRPRRSPSSDVQIDVQAPL